ncbi:unnamed protein product [Microthlaspi erraticum]|uniref:DUF1985 domain-containing protein n=1 Tax=Microthlaspi erraticum TaxID=1685480 RepID=A0A6D2JKJ0_9BRAS|nr:unnamed protein product [Microthlaspi erraticum]
MEPHLCQTTPIEPRRPREFSTGTGLRVRPVCVLWFTRRTLIVGSLQDLDGKKEEDGLAPTSPAPVARNLRSNTRIEESGAVTAVSQVENQGTPAKKDGNSTELPSRLYAADCYPGGPQRLNIYAKANVIGQVVAALQGHEELEHLRQTQFAGLLNLPVARSSNSAKLIHALLAWQLVTRRRYELWTVFGPNPIRFSLREFKRITGLYCGKIPEDHLAERETSPEAPTISPYDLTAANPGAVISHPFLKGSNYDDGAIGLKTALSSRRKFCFLDGSIARPADGSSNHDDWWTIQALLVSWIKMTIDPALRSNISHRDVAKDLWDHLKKRFTVTNRPRINQLKAELVVSSSVDLPLTLTMER